MAELADTVKRCFAFLGYKVGVNAKSTLDVISGLDDYGYLKYVAAIYKDGSYTYLVDYYNYEQLLDVVCNVPMFWQCPYSRVLPWDSLVPADFKDNPFVGKSLFEINVMLDLLQ